MLERTPARTCAAGRFQETARVRQLAATLVRNRSTHEVKYAGLNHDDPLRASCRIRRGVPPCRADLIEHRWAPDDQDQGDHPPPLRTHASAPSKCKMRAPAGCAAPAVAWKTRSGARKGLRRLPGWVDLGTAQRRRCVWLPHPHPQAVGGDIGEGVASASRHGASGEHYSERSPSPRIRVGHCRSIVCDSPARSDVLCPPWTRFAHDALVGALPQRHPSDFVDDLAASQPCAHGLVVALAPRLTSRP